MSPKISYVMPTRNRVEWFPSCLSSLFVQKGVEEEDIEVICVDDASDDDTWDLLQWFAERDPRIKTIRNAGQLGAGLSRNKGAQAAQAPIIGICDDDDIYFEDRTRLILEYFEKHPEMALVNFPYVRIGYNDEQREIFHGAEFDEKAFLKSGTVNYFCNPSVAVKKIDFLEMGGYRPETKEMTDDYQFLKAWVESGRKVGFYPNEYPIGHRVLPSSIMALQRGFDPAWV
jgi:glycosyltransferase involved in cell wall biosynthesis